MRNFQFLVLVLFLSVSFSACKKKKAEEKKTEVPAASDMTKTDMAAGKTPDGMEPVPSGKPDAAGGQKACVKPESGRIVRDTAFPRGCQLSIEENLEIDEGATLTIEPGVRLSFKVDTGIIVKNGKMAARGTASEPIVLTSANSTPAPGDWNGVIFEEPHLPGQVLEHVTIEFAGHGNHTSYTAGIIVAGSQGDGRITLSNCIIRNNANAGIVNRMPNGTFAKIENTTFEKNGGTAMIAHAQTLGAFAENNRLDEKITVSGHIARSVVFPKVAVPFYIDGNLDVGNDENIPKLTLPEGAILRFQGETGLFVAADGAGSLVARKVTFTSHSPSPRSGDWYGVTLREKTTGTLLEDCVIEFAGKDGPLGKGAIVAEGDDVIPKGASIRKLTIKNSDKAFGGSNAVCAELAKAENGITIDGQPFSCPKEE